MKIPCTVEVLTLNSEKTLRRCLESLKDFEDIIVLDGNSIDKTVEIAKKFGARIIPQADTMERGIKISDFSAVRNKGIKEAKCQWFLYIDSDEYLSLEAVEEIRGIVKQSENNTHYVYKLPRKYSVDGEIIERSSMYPNYQMRFFFIPATSGFIKKLHERISIRGGYEVGILKNPEYVPMDNVNLLKKKWHRYAEIQIASSNVTSASFPNFAFNNFVIFLKYLIKYLITFVRGSGKRMPFLYEWYNAYYHIWLIQEAFIVHIKRK